MNSLRIFGRAKGNEPIISYLDSVGMRLNHGDWTGREFYLGVRYAY